MGFGFWIYDLGLNVWSLDLCFRVWALGFRAWDLGFRVWGLGFRTHQLQPVNKAAGIPNTIFEGPALQLVYLKPKPIPELSIKDLI